ncbi:hypothetical protein F2P79_008000 [Pimephales promelas]|nr:hypothetical protein F2P79_008000 [Pimephales promelas]
MEWRIILPVLCLIAAITSPTSVMSQTTVNQTAKVAKINLRFSIAQEFNESYSDLNNTDTKNLTAKITNECSNVFKSRLPTFISMVIQKLSNGSIVVDSVLDFNTTNGSGPNVTQVKDILVEAIRNSSFTFNITNTSINATEIPEASATTSPPPVTTQTTPAKVAKINLAFSITQAFKDIYSNLSDPETKILSNNITSVFTLVYKRRFANFFRMDIQKFSRGSVVVDSVLEFDTTNVSAPNATQVKDILVAAIKNENLTLQINESSISATEITNTNATTTPVTPASAASAEYNITFKLNDQFQTELLDMSSNVATKLATNITTELNGFYRGFRNFNRSKVLKFSNGSIVVDGQLVFNNTVANNPTVLELAKGLGAAVRNGTVKLTIDPASIKITDPNGVSASRSPVLASMLTALWMTLASLLLSAVMH